MIALQTTSEVIDVAKGISDYGAVIMLAALMMVYIVWQIVDNFRRQKRYEEQNTGLAMMAEFARRAAEYFEERAERKVSIDQARAIISTEFARTTQAVAMQIVKIKEANNLDQTDLVRRNVETFLNGLYASTEGMLRKFEFEGHPLSTFIESSWKEQLKARMVEDCATHDFNISRLEEVYRDEFLGYKSLLNQKLDDIQYPKS